jgi:hypothetical protein
MHMCAFPTFMDGACARVPYVVIAHLDYIIGYIVFELLEMLFSVILVHGWTHSCLKMIDSCNHLRMIFQ